MKAAWPFRIAAILLVLSAAGHTYGFLNFKPPTAEGLAVLDSMQRVRFEADGASFTYGGFYTGFGLFVTVYMLFSAFLSWHLSRLSTTDPKAIGSLAWAFCAVGVASFVLGLIYFPVVPAASFGLVALSQGWGAATLRRS
jgi:hypothetical protein